MTRTNVVLKRFIGLIPHLENTLRLVIMLLGALCTVITVIIANMTFFYELPAWKLGLCIFFTSALALIYYLTYVHEPTSKRFFVLFIILAGCSIKFFTGDEVADLGFVLLYSTPLLSIVFLTKRDTNLLITVNFMVCSVMVILAVSSAESVSGLLSSSAFHVHIILFVLFNFALPLSFRDMIQNSETEIDKLEGINEALDSKKVMYQALFNQSSIPKAIVRIDTNELDDTNYAMKGLLGHAWQSSLERIVKDYKKCIVANRSQLITVRHTNFRLTSDSTHDKNLRVVILEDLSELTDLKNTLNFERHQFNRALKIDVETGLQNREGFLEHLSTKPASAIAVIRLERSENYSRGLSKVAYQAYLKTFLQKLNTAIPEATTARISKHIIALAVDSNHLGDVRRQCQVFLNQISMEVSQLDYACQICVGRASPDREVNEHTIDRSVALLYQHVNSSSVIESTDEETYEDRLRFIRRSLRDAIQAKELTFSYQPKFDATQALVGFESLCRWQLDEEHISPMEFIPVAEQYGLITQITLNALEDSCAVINHLKQSGNINPDFSISINVSVKDLVQENFVGEFLAVLNREKIESRYIVCEITETLIAEHWDQVKSNIEILRSFGIKIALDDFGIGYSSLSRIVDIPIDQLKLDKSFVKGFIQDHKKHATIRLILELCRELDIQVVAEGIEQIFEFEALNALGDMHYQGYYFGKPMLKKNLLSSF